MDKIEKQNKKLRRENHEKYSPLTSAAIRSSCEAIRGGGGLSAPKVSGRWLIILFTTGESVMKAMRPTEKAGTDGSGTNINIADLSKEVGYCNQGHFIKNFKRWKGWLLPILSKNTRACRRRSGIIYRRINLIGNKRSLRILT